MLSVCWFVRSLWGPFEVSLGQAKGESRDELTLHSSLDNVQRMHNQRGHHTGAQAGDGLDEGGRWTPMAAVLHIESGDSESGLLYIVGWRLAMLVFSAK